MLPLPGDFAPPLPPPVEADGEAGGAGEALRASRAPARRIAPGERAVLRRRLPAAPKGFTGRAFHNLPSLERVEFYEEARPARGWQRAHRRLC